MRQLKYTKMIQGISLTKVKKKQIFFLANTLKEMKRHEEALECFDKAIQIDPEDLDCLCCKGKQDLIMLFQQIYYLN